MSKVFQDRRDAGSQLAKLIRARAFESPVILGIPRGGVPVAAEVAKMLGADLGVVVTRKLGAPMQPELAFGAITAHGASYINEVLVSEVGIDKHYLRAIQAREVAEAQRRETQFDGRKRPDVFGLPVVIIDDGVATGATAIAAVRSLKARGNTCHICRASGPATHHRPVTPGG